MKRALGVLCLFLALGMVGCPAPKEEPVEELKELNLKIDQMEAELGTMKERLKGESSDNGTRDQLTEDQALLKSRLERLKERAKNQAPAPPSADSPF